MEKEEKVSQSKKEKNEGKEKKISAKLSEVSNSSYRKCIE